MHARAASVDRRFQPNSISCDAAKIPLYVFPVSRFPQIAEDVLLSIVPKHSFTKDQSERHLVDQRFQSGCRPPVARKVRVSPRPEVAMPVAAVVSLHAKSQRFPLKDPAIECDLPGKKRIGVRCSRKADPAFGAQSHAKGGTVAQVPCDRVTVHLQGTLAAILCDGVVANLKVKWDLPSAADVQSLQRKSSE